jgi:uncharacterized surface protein with fasciclin (FAS1) repeats
MSKDTRIRVGWPARLSLILAAILLTPALALANTETTEQQTSTSPEASEALNELASQEGDISEFLKAVEKSGMADALTGETKYTLFAPTNDAFEADSELQALLESDDQQELVNVLRAHIVADDVDPEMAGTIGEAQTVDGGTISLTSEEDGTLKVGDASVVKSDIQQDNLRVYAIDSVLSPSVSSTVASTETAEQGAMSDTTFDELDADSDGYLSEEELQAEQALAAEQEQLDSDSDGRISRTEFAAFEPTESSESASEQEEAWPEESATDEPGP